MLRAISVFCVCVTVALAGDALAGNKRTIAVLGLEVGGTVDSATTDAAREVTKRLREHVNSGTTSYNAAGGEKDLFDIKMTYSCDNEAATCLKKAANDLGANVLLYGRIEKSGSNYKVTLKLFDAQNSDANPKPTTDVIPVATLNAKGTDSMQFANKLFGAVTGEASKVTITLRIAGSQNGTVYLGGREYGHYTSGSIKVTTDEGKIKVAIEPDEKGAQRYEDSFTVNADKSIDITIKTEKPIDNGNPGNTGNGNPNGGNNGIGPGGQDHTHEYGGTVSDNPHSGWRKAFVVSAIGTALAAGAVTFGAVKQYKTGGGPFTFGDNCNPDGSPHTGPGITTSASDCADGNKYAKFTTGAWIGLGVVGTFAIVALYKGYFSSDNDDSKEHTMNGHRKHRDHFAITPVVSPTGAGATVQLDW
jgi:hypothetical protein